MFEKLQKEINKFLKRYNVQLSDSAVSMILGAAVVLAVGLLAYNYFRVNREKTSVTPAELSTEAQQPAPANGDLTSPQTAVALPTTHTVLTGETLWTISEKYFASGFNYVDIAKANGLANPNLLMVGQKLSIPKVEVRKPLVMDAKLYPVVTDSKIEGDSYIVARGDYLWSIAIRAYGDGFKWVEIAKANKLSNPDLIHSGLKLQLPR